VKKRDLLGLRGLSAAELSRILDTAARMRAINERRIKKVPTLRGRTVVLAFFENSTRTRISFDLAARRMGADLVNFSVQGSSAAKGESVLDTIRNLDAMRMDCLIVRHGSSGVPHMLARQFPWPVINAGDGINEHPTQGLLDLLTLRDHLGDLRGRTVAIVGDVLHSRVARSNLFGLRTLGARVLVAGPGPICPPALAELGAEVRHKVDDVIEEADAVMMLRIQRERLGRAMISTSREYAAFYGLDLDRLRKGRPELLVMHPGPVNRGVELAPEVADGGRSVILEQVTNGVAVRMALLFLLLGEEGGDVAA
jgi:aspartate carbamoyltransferase catalytic subunit